MGKNIKNNAINHVVVLISADAEWAAVENYFGEQRMSKSLYGDWFIHPYPISNYHTENVIFFHGGWGKVAAAASTQYLINRWNPQVIINLGTCGGFEGEITKGEIILAEKTIIYDIYEQMGDPEEHIRIFTTEIDTSLLNKPLPFPVNRSLLVSGDRDLFIEDVPLLKSKFHAIAGDWESGAIAWVAKKNQKQCLILRGVTDLDGASVGEAYKGNNTVFYDNTQKVMKMLLDSLPELLGIISEGLH